MATDGVVGDGGADRVDLTPIRRIPRRDDLGRFEAAGDAELASWIPVADTEFARWQQADNFDFCATEAEGDLDLIRSMEDDDEGIDLI